MTDSAPRIARLSASGVLTSGCGAPSRTATPTPTLPTTTRAAPSTRPFLARSSSTAGGAITMSTASPPPTRWRSAGAVAKRIRASCPVWRRKASAAGRSPGSTAPALSTSNVAADAPIEAAIAIAATSADNTLTGILRPIPSIAPAVLHPELAGHAADAARLGALLGGLDQRLDGRMAGDLEEDLGLDRLHELAALAHRHHEGALPADDAVAIVDVEILDVPRARRLQHDRQAVDGDALGDRLVARRRHDAALVVRPIAGDVDDLAGRREAAVGEEPDREVDRARDRGPRGAPGRLLGKRAGKRHGALRVVDHRPRQEHLLVGGAGPFHVDDADAPDHAAPDGVVDGGRAEGLDKALALQLLLVGVHRVRHVDRAHDPKADRKADRPQPMPGHRSLRHDAPRPPLAERQAPRAASPFECVRFATPWKPRPASQPRGGRERPSGAELGLPPGRRSPI